MFFLLLSKIQHYMATNSRYVRELVFERDNGICAHCGEDTKILATLAIRNRQAGGEVQMREYLKSIGISNPRRRVFVRKWGGNLFEVSHKKAVHLGGGCTTELDDLETLCTLVTFLHIPFFKYLKFNSVTKR